jgi:ssDNA-binding Zn-finger/Zn-ribbon topoisomerase 1
MTERPCPECKGATSPFPEGNIGKNVECYRCKNGHLIRVDTRTCEILSIAIPFKELGFCPQCGRIELKKIQDQKYPDQDGIIRLVIYRCLNGHEATRRQLVVKQAGVPLKDLWEGYA